MGDSLRKGIEISSICEKDSSFQNISPIRETLLANLK